jgi:5-bromo-4-chloroindolyl phosphate hydrolysis protein
MDHINNINKFKKSLQYINEAINENKSLNIINSNNSKTIKNFKSNTNENNNNLFNLNKTYSNMNNIDSVNQKDDSLNLEGQNCLINNNIN